MLFKNSVKLLGANFAHVWKLLVFHILSIAFCVGLLAIFHRDFINYFNLAYEGSGLSEVFETGTLYGTGNIASALTKVADFAVLYFQFMFTHSIWIGVYFIFVVFYLLPVLMNIGKVVTCELMYGYMSACQKQSFTGTFLKTLKTSLAYSSIKVLYALPFNALTFLSMWGLTRISNPAFDYIMPFAFVIVPAVFMAFKETFNAGWAPAKVVYNQNVYKSYSIGMRAVLRNGAKVFSTSFVFYLLAIVLSVVLGLYSLIIILPLISPLFHVFEMVSFFSSQGMRFYVDNDTIVSPKKLEEIDKIEDAKYIL